MVTARSPWFLWGASGLGSHGPYLPSKLALGAGAQSTLSQGNLSPRPPALASHYLNCVPSSPYPPPAFPPRPQYLGGLRGRTCPCPCSEEGRGSEPLCCLTQTCDLPLRALTLPLELEVWERQPLWDRWELEFREALRVFTFNPPVLELTVKSRGALPDIPRLLPPLQLSAPLA